MPFVLAEMRRLLRHIHSSPVRDPRFSRLSESDIAFFSDITGGNVISGKESAPYTSDWTGAFCSDDSGGVVVRPGSTEEVQAVISHCNSRQLAVTPQGGNTGLVGGSVPVFDEVVISLSRMNSIRSIDADAGVLVADAGCVLETLDAELSKHGRMMPLDLGAKGSCQIGGNVSTNAGGLRLLRYGSLHGSVLGLEVVRANGGVLDMLNTCRKDNTVS